MYIKHLITLKKGTRYQNKILVFKASLWTLPDFD